VRVLAADSWLLRDGRAIGLDAHRARFLGSVPVELDGARFWDAVVAALPRDGEWFPRLELRGVGLPGEERREFALRVRPAPALRTDLALVTHDAPDPRHDPTIKGPDLERLTAVRTAAQARGADDAVLRDAHGSVVETTTANLVWWRDDALVVPDPAIRQLAGVTVGALVALATALGVEVRRERAAPAALQGVEMWALNALHGIRVVTAWHGGPAVTAQPGRAELWRRRLEALRRPLPEAVPA